MDTKFLINQFHDIKKMENENFMEFNIIFQHMLNKLPPKVNPQDIVILLYYVNAFDGQFEFCI